MSTRAWLSLQASEQMLGHQRQQRAAALQRRRRLAQLQPSVLQARSQPVAPLHSPLLRLHAPHAQLPVVNSRLVFCELLAGLG